MSAILGITVVAAGLAVAGCTAVGSSSAGTKTPKNAAASISAQVTLTPAASVSLAGWTLTLPVNSAGKLSGTAQVISPAAIVSPWLTRDSDGALAFWAPAGGATTPNSDHSRTELVSTSVFELGKASHTLAATLAVTQVPDDDHDIILGQIHGGGSISSVPFVMLHWQSEDIVVVVKKYRSGSSAQNFTLLKGVPLDGSFSYTLADDGNGELTLTATYGSQTGKATAKIPSDFRGKEVRFQVGDYQQATTGISSADGGRVVFSAITSS